MRPWGNVAGQLDNTALMAGGADSKFPYTCCGRCRAKSDGCCYSDVRLRFVEQKVAVPADELPEDRRFPSVSIFRGALTAASSGVVALYLVKPSLLGFLDTRISILFQSIKDGTQ